MDTLNLVLIVVSLHVGQVDGSATFLVQKDLSQAECFQTQARFEDALWQNKTYTVHLPGGFLSLNYRCVDAAGNIRLK